ncbi:sulfotransferase [filamentous cyanobacterium CCT1]|nr:sulfotransferase [filamentous cyanobacterium CCT1]PSN81521.1 sulfotransferase [filamentous cyanobacterium CCP4]
MASLFHPLCGSNPPTLLKLFLANGPPALNRCPQAALALAVSLARWPFSTAERAAFALAPQPPMPDPIFIVGYWRSGTTHLHNLLAQSPAFGYITPLATGMPWDILGIVRSLEPLLEQVLPQDRYVDNVTVTPTSPQEDSIPLATMGATSYYHGMYFPKHFETHFRRDVFGAESEADIERWKRLHRHLLQKVSVHQGHRPLLIKNPVYTGYIRHLRSLWPRAKFIHIYRNPYRVFVSARHYFTRLLPELALQDYGDLPIESLVLESYPFLLDALKNDTSDLLPNQFTELSFEALQSDPLGELKALFEQLELPGFEAAHPYFEAYLADLKDYQQNQYSLGDKTIRAVEDHWQPYIQRWGYRLEVV